MLQTVASSENKPKTTIIPETNISSPRPDGKMPPAIELEYLSRLIFLIVMAEQTPAWLDDHVADCCKCKSSDERQQHLALCIQIPILTSMPNETGDVDNFPSSLTYPQLKDMFRQVNEADKQYDAKILNVLVDLSDHGMSINLVCKSKSHADECM